MLPLIPTLALALASFFSSAFVILRIVIPVLPPHPLSRRVPPSEFGLPNFKTLSPADKSHVWLAALDVVALLIFVWQALVEYFGGPSGFGVVSDPGSAIRLWIATTLRQSCLLVVAGLTLTHVRMGLSVSFGAMHWMLWAPMLLLAVTSTGIAGTLAGAGVHTFFWGLLGYSTAVSVLSSAAFGCLIGTLVIIKKNLVTLDHIRDPWPPAKPAVEPRRASFDTADVDALKDGSSWITSRASSGQGSISAFSFSTSHTSHSRMPSNASSHMNVHPATGSHLSIPSKSPFWFTPATPGRSTSPVPPVPPLPAPYRASTQSYNVDDDPDPFRAGYVPRLRVESQSSWLTEPSGYQPTLSAWSFPPSSPGSPCQSSPGAPSRFLSTADNMQSTTLNSLVPAMLSRDILGGYGYAPEGTCAEKGANAVPPPPSSEIDVSVYRAIGWLVIVWVPMILALPYYVTIHPHVSAPSTWSVYLLILSVTISSPLLAANIVLRSPLPIPSGLFDTPADPPSVVMRAPSPVSTCVGEYKRSTSASVTVVEGRRSGDVWVARGNAVEAKGKLGRALTLLQPKPKLCVMPLESEDPKDAPLSPPLPMQDADEAMPEPVTPQSTSNAEFALPQDDRSLRKKDSKASSYWSGMDENTAIATQILIAQRHYSTLAMRLVLPPSPERRDMPEDAASTAVETASTKPARSSHLRARSVSSIASGPPSPLGGPPSTPLPPTPPTLKNFKAASAAKRRAAHRRSYSSTADEFSFGPTDGDDTRELDTFSSGLLPLLQVPGARGSSEMKVTQGWRRAPAVTTNDGRIRKSRVLSEIGDKSATHERKMSAQVKQKVAVHKRGHFSLPSLSLGNDRIQALATWGNDLNQAIDTKMGTSYLPIPGSPDEDNTLRTPVYEGEYSTAMLQDNDISPSPSPSGFQSTFHNVLDVPQGVNTARSSVLTLIAALDEELQLPSPSRSAASDETLFDFDPVASSTPHESKLQPRRSPSPAPEVPSKTAKRSSIVYYKSDSDENTPPPPIRLVRPLQTKPKAYKAPKLDQAPARGLRPLALLQNQDVSSGTMTDVYRDIPVIKPLALTNKNKSKKTARAGDENTSPKRNSMSSMKRALKPLKLARSDTTKERAILRAREGIPAVVVRPPSNGQYIFSSYEFSA